MASRVHNVTFDSHDPYAAATFWSAVLGHPPHPDDQPGDPEAVVVTDTINVLFERVPEEKSIKNRVHVDLQPEDRSRDEEVARLLALGAVVLADRRRPDGTGWVVLSDPEGNEFCVERSTAERERPADPAPAP